MIRYALICSEEHSFESWFQSGTAYEKLTSTGMLTCPSCGSDQVRKAIMSPQVGASDKAAAPEAPVNAVAKQDGLHALSAPSSPAEAALAELKKKIQENSEYVGSEFAREARKIHDGDAPERSIYGEAKPEEAKKLIEDGVPVAPLPFVPIRKTN